MKYHFEPAELQLLSRAFEAAWHEIESEACAADRNAIRDHIGRAVVTLAMDGKLDETRLASYAAYQGRRFMGRVVASISVHLDCAKS